MSGRIIAGKERGVDQTPTHWQVKISAHDKILKKFLGHCGGVLLSKKYILSAAHCKHVLLLDGTDEALIGAKAATEKDKIHTLSKTYYVHPDYEEFLHPKLSYLPIYDFMLLILNPELALPCPSRFVRLPMKSADSDLIRKTLITVGWGSITPASHEQVIKHKQEGTLLDMPNHMHEVEIHYVRSSICQERYQGVFDGYGQSEVRGVKRAPNAELGLYGLNELPGKYFGKETRFDEGPGLSMICGTKGICQGDSGCKYSSKSK